MPAQGTARTSHTFRLEADTVATLAAVADGRFAGNRTAALAAAIAIAGVVYSTAPGRGGADPADALERWCSARRRSGADDDA